MIVITDIEGILSKGTVLSDTEKELSKLTDKDGIIIVTPNNNFSMNKELFSILRKSKANVDFQECKTDLDFAYLCGKLAERSGKNVRLLVSNKDYAIMESILSADGIGSKNLAKRARSNSKTAEKKEVLDEIVENKSVDKPVSEKKTQRNSKKKANIVEVDDLKKIPEKSSENSSSTNKDTSSSKSKGKRPPMEDIRKFFEKYDTKEFKMSSSAATIWDAFKRHLLDNRPIEDTLKEILLVDSKVDAVMNILSNQKILSEIEAYIRKTL